MAALLRGPGYTNTVKRTIWPTVAVAILLLGAVWIYFSTMDTTRTPLSYTDTPDEKGFCGTVAVTDGADASIAAFRICEDEVAEAYETESSYVVRTQGGREWSRDKATGAETMKDAPPPGFSGSFTRIKE
jgi:hypothetical protein